jgi:activator of 2-hydroxyglutaryl-CoA dehydratase
VKELKRESRMVSLLEKNSVEGPNKKDMKKVKKSKSKSKSSRSVKRTIGSDSGSKASFKNGVRREVKKINSKVVINPKKSIRINKN